MTCALLLPLHAQVPGLAVVLVGNRKDSETYVRSKKKSCVEVGIESFGTELPEEATEEEVLKVRAPGTLLRLCPCRPRRMSKRSACAGSGRWLLHECSCRPPIPLTSC